MAVSKDIEKGTWTSQVWVEDWQGKKKHKKKRGFATKKEALEWEHSILLAAKAVYCTIKIPKVAEGNPKSCMRIFPIIADVFGISLRPQQVL